MVEKIKRFPINGVLLLNKPVGISSNSALQKVRFLLKAEKGGHSGTLDPLASGVLILSFGLSTKFCNLHLDADKTYLAKAKLGFKTSTGDSEGEILEKKLINLDLLAKENLLKIQHKFTGKIKQIPPMFSALKKDGKNLYELARQGIEIERKERIIEIKNLNLKFIYPDILEIEVNCSKGTYIRTLAEDIGKELNCGAYLTELKRIKSGFINLEDCINLEDFEQLEGNKVEQLKQLKSADYLLENQAKIILDNKESEKFLKGQSLIKDFKNYLKDNLNLAIYKNEIKSENLLGIADILDNKLIPKRLLSFNEIQQINKLK